MLRSITSLVVLFCASTLPTSSQDISGSRATAVLDKTTVKADELVTLHLHLDRPSTFNGSIWATFSPPPNSGGGIIQFSAPLEAGKQDVTAEQKIPSDAAGGVYSLNEVYFRVSRVYQLKFEPITLTVVAAENPIVPTSAKVALDPTEKQFLATNATALKHVLENLTTELDIDASDTTRLRVSLAKATHDADGIFLNALKAYPLLKKKSLASPPIFLEDFEARFKQALDGLRSPSTVANQMPSLHGRLIFVQTNPARLNTHTYPLLALGIIDLLQKGIKAFEASDEKDSYYFDLSVNSRPTGARIYYTRLLHPYEQFASETNIPKMTLQYAFWTVFFEKEGCETTHRDVDPYNDPNPRLTVDIDCHANKR